VLFAAINYDPGFGVGDDSCILGLDVGVRVFSIMLKAPQTFCSAHTDLKALTSRPSRVHIMVGSIDIERPLMLYSEKRMRSLRGYALLVYRTREQTSFVYSKSCEALCNKAGGNVR
jgi:hypothetical protein